MRLLSDTEDAKGAATKEDGARPSLVSRRGFMLSALALPLLPSIARASWDNFVTPADSWPQFRGNLLLSGYSSSGIGNLRHLWAADAGESVESSAAVAGGAVFVGTQRGELVSVNLGDGDVRWRYGAGNRIGESSPAV